MTNSWVNNSSTVLCQSISTLSASISRCLAFLWTDFVPSLTKVQERDISVLQRQVIDAEQRWSHKVFGQAQITEYLFQTNIILNNCVWGQGNFLVWHQQEMNHWRENFDSISHYLTQFTKVYRSFLKAKLLHKIICVLVKKKITKLCFTF